MHNYKLVISYDGTDYHGWQRQPDKKTIQGLLEETLARIVQKKVNIIGAGRTDAGVHALGQVASFKAEIGLKDEELHRALNSMLPGDIRIISLEKVNREFHARKMALSKTYVYRIFNSQLIPPFLHRYALYWPYPLDVKAMARAASLFEREADFSSFSSNRTLNPVRKITFSQIAKRKQEIVYTVKASGFLRYMVRTIVGTLLEIGKGKLAPEDIEEMFREKKRTPASPTAPAKGLFLLEVEYPDNSDASG